MIRIAFLLFSVFPTAAMAQFLTQTMRGQVTDADTGRPLTGVAVLLRPGDLVGVSDSSGGFMVERVPVGRYTVEVRHNGYAPVFSPEVLIESGKECVLDFQLYGKSADLAEVVVRASRSDLRIIAPTSVTTLTNEETRRFPAAFFDPARVAISMAGATVTNDQANGMSIRGNTPNGLVWRLEGIDIVNPNHTPNAGSRSDRVTAFGGGVNILSAQLLSATHFLSGAFPAEYGNALSGILDMRLRPGNHREMEFTAQAGLIGLDFAAEGPFSKKSAASYLVNYRYSTIGLLSALGVPLGDEDIRFQDLSFNLVFPAQNGASWSVFSLAGNSINLFEANRDSLTWEFQKDRFDIRFRSKMGAAGITFTQPLGLRGQVHTVLGASALLSLREGDLLDNQLQPQEAERDRYNQQKISLHSVYRHKISDKHRLRAGLMLTDQKYDILAVQHQAQDTLAQGRGGGLLWQPYDAWTGILSDQLTINAGMHTLWFDFNQTGALEPRFSLQWSPQSKQRFSIAYGLHAQLQQPQLYFATTDFSQRLGPTRAHHIVAGWYLRLRPSLFFQAETYYQQLFKVPIAASGSFSALNLLENFFERPLTNSGKGRNYGVEVSLRQLVFEDAWFSTNATWYNSYYTAADGIERNTRFNGRFAINFSGGKEWRKSKKDGLLNRVWGVSGRLIWNGGFWESPIDLLASQAIGNTVFDETQAFSIRLPAFFRPDLRIYLQRNRPHSSSALSLDIQNVISRKNVAFTLYDYQQGKVLQRFQLGIIPVLGYRIEF